MKILVTGDRGWDNITRVVEILQRYPAGTILIHGACTGADTVCGVVGEALGFEVRPYPADWDRYHRAAGPIRNQQVLDAENGVDEPIDLCLAFHDDMEHSRGTRDMIGRVKKTVIPWKLITSMTEVEGESVKPR